MGGSNPRHRDRGEPAMSLLYPFDDPSDPRHSPPVIALLVGGFLLILLALTACAGRTQLPPPAPPAVPVYIPVVQPCEVEQVDTSPLSADDGVPMDIYAAVQQIVADIMVLKADREELKAANTDPCPEVQ